MPRIVLAEFNTHRVFSRNSASSRAIPVEKRVAQVRENPYVPLQFGANQRGMQASRDEVQDTDQARAEWLYARDAAARHARELSRIGLHKQWANRLLEPFAWHTVIVSATEWDNFFALRISEHAQPEIRKLAENMKAAMDASAPELLEPGEWHLPLANDTHTIDTLRDRFRPAEVRGAMEAMRVRLSVARCAAVSYERHMQQDIDADLARYEKLRAAGHMSPFEHAAVVGTALGSPRHSGTTALWVGWNGVGMPAAHARCFGEAPFVGNFRAPWIQHRKLIAGEAVFGT